MKKIFLILIVIVPLLATSCSNDTDPVPASSSGKIGFYATAPKSSRAASTTTATLESFVVYAFTNSSVVMNGVTVSRNGGSWTYSPSVYWPALPVDFYAVSPETVAKNEKPSDGSNSISKVECGDIDLLYAVALDQVENPAPVALTFRHAMSRVALMLSSTSNRYSIEVYHVSLNNISLWGDFSLPEADTSDGTGVGTWGNLSETNRVLVYYSDLDTAPSLLSITPRDLTEGNLNMSFFVPQPLSPLTYSSEAGFLGSYMQIDCIVKDKLTGEKVWPNDHTPDYLLVDHSECGRMIFPLSTPAVTEWRQGYSYIYNVEINSTYSVDTIEFVPTVTDYLVSKPF